MRGTRLARRDCRAGLVALFSLLAASCSSTSDPTLELSSPAFTAGMVAGDTDPDAAAAVVAEGDSDLPTEIAAVPAARPDGQDPAIAKGSATSNEQPVASASADETAKPAADGAASDAGEAALTAEAAPPPAIEPKKKSFLSSFFGSSPASPSPAAAALASKSKAKAKPLLVLASAEPAAEPKLSLASLGDGGSVDALPGVRQDSLFEITHKSGIEDNSDVDLYEEAPSVRLASAAGLARLAPNGLLKQRESVDVGCLKPELVRMLKTVERHFGKKMVITSGYRSPAYNRKVNGAKRSQHMHCAAADVQVPGVSKWELARYVRALPGRGGVGTYCHTESVHIDVGPERDWNWNCRRRKT